MKKILSLILVLLMIVSSCLMITSCNDTDSNTESSSESSSESTQQKEEKLYTADTTLGTGNTTFTLVVEHIDGTKVNFTIKTDKTILSDALIEVGILEGHNDTYGLYIDKVNGITQSWDVDQTYWAIYEGDNYASSGIDGITVATGATYKLVASK